jgi:hypothetical protein
MYYMMYVRNGMICACCLLSSPGGVCKSVEHYDFKNSSVLDSTFFVQKTIDFSKLGHITYLKFQMEQDVIRIYRTTPRATCSCGREHYTKTQKSADRSAPAIEP